MRKYATYKDSGIEWIGEIPEHWKLKRIKHTTYVKGRIGWKGLRSDEFLEKSDSLLVTGTDFSNGEIIWDTCYQVPKERYDEDPFIQLRENDLLITKDGTIGKVALVKNLPKIATLNSGIFVTRPLYDDYLTEFMYWILNSTIFLSFIDYNKSGSTVLHLYQNVFNEFTFICPPLSEQTQIANYLDGKTAQIDELVAKKEKLITLLQEERTALINQAVTQGLDPTVPRKDSGIEWLGEIPAHWEVKKMKYLTNIFRGKFSHRPRNDESLYGGKYPFIQTGDVARSEKHIRKYTQTLNERGFSVTKEFPAGTLVMTIAANIGDIAILGFDACFPDSIVGFYPNEEIDIDFLYNLLKVLRGEFHRTSIENTQLNLNVERIENIKCAIPPLTEQNKISEFIQREFDRIDSIISKTHKEIKLLKEYKTALISEVVTGKVDVREEVLA